MSSVQHLSRFFFLQMLRCLVCHATFNTQSDMEQHLASHSKQFQCQFCSEAFHIEFLLDRHIQTHHSSTVSYVHVVVSAC